MVTMKMAFLFYQNDFVLKLSSDFQLRSHISSQNNKFNNLKGELRATYYTIHELCLSSEFVY